MDANRTARRPRLSARIPQRSPPASRPVSWTFRRTSPVLKTSSPATPRSFRLTTRTLWNSVRSSTSTNVPRAAVTTTALSSRIGPRRQASGLDGFDARQGRLGRVDPLELEPGRGEQLAVFGRGALPAGQEHQHVDVRQVRPAGAAVFRDDHLHHQHAAAAGERFGAVAQEDGALLVVPVVENLL